MSIQINMTPYDKKVHERKIKYGKAFNDINIHKGLIQYFNSGDRIEVAKVAPKGMPVELLRGTIGITTGWQPVFLLIKRRDSIGSDILLYPGEYEFVRVIPRRKVRS